jgi:hypothetical protein
MMIVNVSADIMKFNLRSKELFLFHPGVFHRDFLEDRVIGQVRTGYGYLIDAKLLASCLISAILRDIVWPDMKEKCTKQVLQTFENCSCHAINDLAWVSGGANGSPLVNGYKELGWE